MRLFRNVHTFDALALRDFRYIWLAQVAVAMGTWMDNVTRSWLMYMLTQSPLQLGLVSAAKGIPLLIFGLVAGAIADRYGRKNQLVVAQSLNAVLNLTLALLVLTKNIQPWHLYGAAFLEGTVQAFQQPARHVLINELVGERHLLNAVSLNSVAGNLSKSIGPALGGLLIQAAGVQFSYFVQGGFFVLATLWTVRIRVPQAVTGRISAGRADRAQAGTPVPPVGENHRAQAGTPAPPPPPPLQRKTESLFSGIGEAMRYVRSQKLILALLIVGLGPVLLGTPFTSLMPIFAIEVFQGDARTQGLLLTALGVGALVGGLAMASLGKWQGSGKFLIAGAAGFGLSLALFAYSPFLALAVFFVLLAGAFDTAYASQDLTMIQLLTPSELRGRVLGIRLLDKGLQPVGSVLAGALASLFGGPTAVLIMGASCLALAVAVGIGFRSLWRLKYPGKEKGLPVYVIPGE